MRFKDEDFDKSEYLTTEEKNIEFRIESAFENDRGAFEAICVVSEGPLSGQRISAKFWRNKETGNWSSFLKYFLTRFPGCYTESALGYKTIRDDINIFSFLKGKFFYADTVLGKESPTTGKRYLQLENFRTFEIDASTWIDKPNKKNSIDDLNSEFVDH